jgi:hypothetical protein
MSTVQNFYNKEFANPNGKQLLIADYPSDDAKPVNCTVKDLQTGTYDKWPKHGDGEFVIIWEYKTMLTEFFLE